MFSLLKLQGFCAKTFIFQLTLLSIVSEKWVKGHLFFSKKKVAVIDFFNLSLEKTKTKTKTNFLLELNS